MRIGLFSASITSYEVTRLNETAHRLGHELVVVPYQTLLIGVCDDPEDPVSIRVGSNSAAYQAKVGDREIPFKVADAGIDLLSFDIVVTRSANRSGEPLRAGYAMWLNQFFSRHGIPMLNGRALTPKGASKSWQHQLLVDAALPVVPTRFVAHEDLLEEAAADLSFPVFVKPSVGTHGKGAGLVTSLEQLRGIYHEDRQSPVLLIQDFLPGGVDFRVLVLGGEVLGAIQRTAAVGSHVTNYGSGGSVVEGALSPGEEKLAVDVTRILDADFGGVDLMRGPGGETYVLEFNSNPQFFAFESEVDVDVPEAIFEYLKIQRGN